MKLKIFDKILLAILAVELAVSYVWMNNLTLFQHAILMLILPAIVLAIVGGRLAVKFKYKWTMVFIVAFIYALIVFGVMSITPMDVIEGNTVQSKTSVITFNRNAGAFTYLGFFIQEYIMTAFVVIIGSILLKIKKYKF